MNIRIFKSSAIAATVCAALVSASFGCNAQKADQPEAYVTIKLNGADLKTAPKSGSTTVAPLKMGEIYSLTEEPKNGFVKARNIATGTEGYIDTLIINHIDSPLTSPQPADEEVSEPLLVNREMFEQGEAIVKWDFWKTPDGGIRVIEERSVVYNDGRARAQQFYYKGTLKDGYLLVTESVQHGEENGTKLDTPIIIWQDVADNAGVYIDGKFYYPNDPDNPGGFDTDDWGE